MKNEKPYNCLSTIPRASKFGRALTYGWRAQPSKSCDCLITWSCEKLKNVYLYFNNIYDSQTWQSRGLGLETLSPKSRQRLTKWLCGHFLLNVFKASVAIILRTLGLLSAVIRFLDDKIILMLSYLTLRSSSP